MGHDEQAPQVAELIRLRDARTVLVRPVGPDDVDALRRAIDEADKATLRLRFLGGRPPHSQEELRRLVDLDHVLREAFVALAPDGRMVGITRYAAIDGTAAEVAIAVDRDWRHVGLATALLRRLLRAAADHGITTVHAAFYATNRDVRSLILDLGGESPADARAGVVEAVIPLDPSRLR